MSSPLVSVVMAVYNGEKYLQEAVSSILSQSYRNLELILIDDGSTDGSKNIILAFQDERIRFLENVSNAGIVFTRNRGLEEARGKYIATLDCDDVALPGRIARQVNFLEEHPDYALCGTFYKTIDPQGRTMKKIRYPSHNQDIITFLTLGNCFCNSTVMLRSDLAKQLKYKDLYFIGEDYDLWCRMSRLAKCVNLPLFGSEYRVHGSSITVQKADDMFALVEKIYRQILTDLPIAFSERELTVHTNFLNRNISFFNDKTNLNDLELWICRFYKTLKGYAKYNDSLLYKLLAEKWIVILVNTKNYKKLSANRFFRLRRSAYFGSFCNRVWHKITERSERNPG